jgi:hypothetical protein
VLTRGIKYSQKRKSPRVTSSETATNKGIYYIVESTSKENNKQPTTERTAREQQAAHNREHKQREQQAAHNRENKQRERAKRARPGFI